MAIEPVRQKLASAGAEARGERLPRVFLRLAHRLWHAAALSEPRSDRPGTGDARAHSERATDVLEPDPAPMELGAEAIIWEPQSFEPAPEETPVFVSQYSVMLSRKSSLVSRRSGSPSL